MQILVVEDDPSIRMLLESLLLKYGYQVTTCENAELAWDYYQNHDIPLIILDWVLPGMSGLDLCRKIKETPKGKYAYIWMITARNSPEDVLKVLKAGANDYLDKPIDINYLKIRATIAEQQASNLQKRKVAEEALQKTYGELEVKVKERTVALSETVQALENEIQVRKQTEHLVTETKNQLRALSAHLISIQEEQQRRISREIHDELGQAMTAIKIDLVWLEQQLPEELDLLKEKIFKLVPLVSNTIKTIQRICAELRPGILDDLGLVSALEWLCQEFQERTQIQCQLDILPEELVVPNELGTPVFRICQETMTNVMRHAEASRFSIFIHQDPNELYIEIRDNGRGITREEQEDPMSLGLIGMRERVLPWNGEVSIQGKPGQGTQITVKIPLVLEGVISHD